MRYVDELHGSVGEPCIVSSTGPQDIKGVIAKIEGEIVTVETERGDLIYPHFSRVTLTMEEDEAMEFHSGD